MPERDPNTGRFLENILYGTPVYPGSTTADGRTVTEIHRGRIESAQRQDQMVALQRDTVSALRALHSGESVVSREAYLAKEGETQEILREAAGRMAALELGQRDLVAESQLLTQISAHGFAHLGDGLDRVSQGVEALGETVAEGNRTLHGPTYPTVPLSVFMARQQTFMEVLGAYQRGMLSPQAERDFESWISQNFGSPTAHAEVERFLREEVSEDRGELVAEVERRSQILERPTEWLRRGATEEARGSLMVLERIASHTGSIALTQAVQRLRALTNLGDESRKSGISEGFLVELANNGLVSDGIQHEYKRRYREARRPGSGVDRSYHLMELLDQGDHAGRQRETGLQQGSAMLQLGRAQWLAQATLVRQGGESHRQREGLLAQGERQIALLDETAVGVGELVDQGETLVQVGLAQLAMDASSALETHRRLGEIALLGHTGNAHLEELVGQTALLVGQGATTHRFLGHISTELGEANEHLVNLEVLGHRFLTGLEEGLANVSEVIRTGFELQAEVLAELTFEVALTRAEVVGRLESLEATVERGLGTIEVQIQRTNELLAQLVDLTAHPLRTRARERLQQGVGVMKRSRTPQNVRSARKLFEQAIEEDPTIPEAHFGLAATAELLKDHEAASEHYERVGEDSLEEKTDLAINGWQGYARVREATGDLSESIRGLRSALERDAQNKTTMWLLARALALAGLHKEAMEHLLALAAHDERFIFEVSHEKGFSGFPMAEFYRAVWQARRISSSEVRTHLAHELLRLGDETSAETIVTNFLEWEPQSLLRSTLLQPPWLERIRSMVNKVLRRIMGESRALAAEAWYALSFIALRSNASTDQVAQLLRRGLEQDYAFHLRNWNAVVQELQGIDPEQVNRLLNLLRASDPSLGWLKSNS